MPPGDDHGSGLDALPDYSADEVDDGVGQCRSRPRGHHFCAGSRMTTGSSLEGPRNSLPRPTGRASIARPTPSLVYGVSPLAGWALLTTSARDWIDRYTFGTPFGQTGRGVPTIEGGTPGPVLLLPAPDSLGPEETICTPEL